MMNRETRRAQDYRPKLEDVTAMFKAAQNRIAWLEKVVALQYQTILDIGELHELVEYKNDSGDSFESCSAGCGTYPCETIKRIERDTNV